MSKWFHFLVFNNRGETDITSAPAPAPAPQDITDTPPVDVLPENPAPAPQNTVKWPSGFDTSLSAEPLFKPFINKETGEINYGPMMKSYYHAQKQVGRDKVAIPGDHSSQEEWDNFYQKTLGVDPAEENYKPVFEAEKVKHFEQPVLDSFRKKAHELRIPPKAAAQMVEFFNEQVDTAVNSSTQKLEQNTAEGFSKLQQEWGEAYNQRVTAAKRFINEQADESFKQYLKESNLASDPQVFRFFGELASKFYSEGSIPKGGAGTGELMTPSQASVRINEVMADRSHPYHNAKDPRHGDAVKEMKRFFQMKSVKRA